MNIKKIVLAITLLGVSFLMAQNHAINFETGTWDQILKKAKAEKKLIMLDAYASWCGPCKTMAKNTFTDKSVADFYNKKFINASIDWEKGEGPTLAQKYMVKAYPTILYIDGDGMEIHRGVGAAQPKEFIEWGKQAQSPEKNDMAIRKKYETNKNDKKFVKNYLQVSAKVGAAENRKVLAQYFSLLNDKEKFEKENMEILLDNLRNAGKTEMDFFKKNYSTFKEKINPNTVNWALKSLYMGYADLITRTPNSTEQQYKDLVAELTTYKFSFADTLAVQLDMFYYKRTKNLDAYVEASKKYFDNYGKNDINEMNSVAWHLYEKSDNPIQLEAALSWSKTSVTEQKNQWAYWDTYACLLNKTNKKQEALQAAEEAVKLAKAEKLAESDYAETQKLIEKLRKELQ